MVAAGPTILLAGGSPPCPVTLKPSPADQEPSVEAATDRLGSRLYQKMSTDAGE